MRHIRMAETGIIDHLLVVRILRPAICLVTGIVVSCFFNWTKLGLDFCDDNKRLQDTDLTVDLIFSRQS